MDTEKRHTGACKPEVGRGCAFCNCGSEPEAKLCDGCFKLHETAWLDEYPVNMPSDIVEVRFKNTRRSFYQNVNNLDLKRGDIVAVEASPGHDIGRLAVHRFGDPRVKQSLLPAYGDDAHGIFSRHLKVADRAAPVVPCPAFTTMPEPDAHRLFLRQCSLYRAISVRNVQFAAGDDRPAAQRQHDARRAQHLQSAYGAADVEALDHTCVPAASIIRVSASGVAFFAAACSASSFGVGVFACAFSILVTGGLCSTKPSVTLISSVELFSAD